jgi:hypothetical protein
MVDAAFDRDQIGGWRQWILVQAAPGNLADFVFTFIYLQ